MSVFRKLALAVASIIGVNSFLAALTIVLIS